MNLSLNWVQDFTDVTGIAPKDYCDRMTDTGSKVEGFRLLGDDIENVVVGKITKITKHENSDHLQICMINVGKGEDVQIVTGAQNVFEGASLGDFSPRKWSSKSILGEVKYKYDEENNPHQAPLTPIKPHIHTKKNAGESPHNLLDYWDDLHQNILKNNSSGDFSPKK